MARAVADLHETPSFLTDPGLKLNEVTSQREALREITVVAEALAVKETLRPWKATGLQLEAISTAAVKLGAAHLSRWTNL